MTAQLLASYSLLFQHAKEEELHHPLHKQLTCARAM